MRGAAELLAVHADAGRLLQRLDDLTFDRQVDLGGEVVALLGDRGLRAVTGDERLGRVVEDRRGLGDQSVEVERRPAPSGSYRLTAASASGRVNRPA